MHSKIRNYLLTRTCLGCVLGILGGFAYYYFKGCSSGTCPITSNPFISILFGALMGGILFYKPKPKSAEKKDETFTINNKHLGE